MSEDVRQRLGWLGECGEAWRRPYGRQFFGAVAAWSLLTVVVDVLQVALTGTPRVLVALLPVLAAAWAMGALGQYLRDADELERRKYIEALTFAFAVTFLAAAIGAQLDLVGTTLVRANELLVVMLVSWSLGYVLAAWRYR